MDMFQTRGKLMHQRLKLLNQHGIHILGFRFRGLGISAFRIRGLVPKEGKKYFSKENSPNLNTTTFHE